ncbi:MAG: glucose-1-phosphate thymidylyltransferase RfbA [Clostridia bacterium]|nr:glucose-1-phosphate thymidylyltransferase RfbA [Clostridia bacterium]
MKGIILAGGKGTRMYPMTKAVTKQLLPVYDKPMIYYPLSVLLLGGIREIMIISDRENLPLFRELLGDGSDIGIELSYAVQERPGGIAESFIIASDFIGGDDVCLILGDNIFYGQDLTARFEEAKGLIESKACGAVVFGYPVKNPCDFGVVEFDDDGRVISVEEKPSKPRSDFAIPGLYFYANDVKKVAAGIEPSERGEKEITAVNEVYLKRGELRCIRLYRGFAWLDTGTPERLLKASEFISTVQNTQGFYVSCIEEIAWRRGFISKQQLKKLGRKLIDTEYGKYLVSLED